MSTETPLTDDQRLILAARELARSPYLPRSVLVDAVDATAMLRKLADRLEFVVAWRDDVTKERDAAELRARNALAAGATEATSLRVERDRLRDRVEAILQQRNESDDRLVVAEAEIQRLLRIQPGSFRAAPAPVAIALRETFAVEFSLTPATAASLVSGEDERILSDDERNAGAIRIRVTIKGGDSDVRVYRMGPNELGEQVWHDVEFSSTTFHGFYLDDETAIALAFRFLTITRRGADEPILSLGEF